MNKEKLHTTVRLSPLLIRILKRLCARLWILRCRWRFKG